MHAWISWLSFHVISDVEQHLLQVIKQLLLGKCASQLTKSYNLQSRKRGKKSRRRRRDQVYFSLCLFLSLDTLKTGLATR